MKFKVSERRGSGKVITTVSTAKDALNILTFEGIFSPLIERDQMKLLARTGPDGTPERIREDQVVELLETKHSVILDNIDDGAGREMFPSLLAIGVVPIEDEEIPAEP